MCKRECTGQGDGQGHSADHDKWSRTSTGPAKHTRGVSQPSGEIRQAKTTEKERREKVRKTVLPVPNAPCLAHEPRNGPTHILAVAVWLKISQKVFQ